MLATVGSFSNLNAASGYSQKTADLSAYAGQTITLKFTGSRDRHERRDHQLRHRRHRGDDFLT